MSNNNSSSAASVFTVMLMKKFSSNEKQNSSASPTMSASTYTPGIRDLLQAEGENLEELLRKCL